MYVLISSLISSIITFFGATVARSALRIAFTIAVIAFLVSIVVQAYTAYSSMLDTLNMSVPAIFSQVWSWIMPSNARQCLFLPLSASMIRFGLELKIAFAITRAKLLKL